MIPPAMHKLDEALDCLRNLRHQCKHISNGNLSHRIASIDASAHYCIILIEEAKNLHDETEQQKDGRNARG
jgi:hypothetical protein